MNLKQLKKYFLISLSLASLLTINAFAEGERDFQITVNTKEIPLNNNVGMPFVEYDRTFVPIRVVSENLGYKVDWNQDKKLVTINGNKKVELVVGKTSAKVQGKKVAIDSTGKVASVLKNNRTYVPLRFVSEQMGAKVDYKQTPKLHIINITKDGVQVAQNDAPEGYLRPGETKDDVLRRAQSVNKMPEGNSPGKVSEKWIDPKIEIVYIDPFNNDEKVQLPFYFGIKNYNEFKNKPSDKYWVKIEIDDDRYVPYENHFEVKTENNQWKPFGKVDIDAVTKTYPLSEGGRGIAPFHFFDYSKISGTLLRTKGYSRVVAPYHGDLIDYKATIYQDGEEHVYKFKVVYGRVMTDYTLNKYVPKDQREYQKNVFEKTNFYCSETEKGVIRQPLNWTQVK